MGANVTERACHPVSGAILSPGVWLKANPLNFTIPNLVLQIILFSIFQHLLILILKPLGQPSVVAKTLGGVMLGPSVLGRSSAFTKTVFPFKSLLILDPLSRFSFIFVELMVGIRMHPTAMFKAGKIPIVIGILCNVIPLFMGGAVTLLLSSILHIDSELASSLCIVILVQSMSVSPVITNFMREIKILNSELGRLAASSSMISDMCTFMTIGALIFASILDQKHGLEYMIGSMISLLLFVLAIVCIFRPAAVWVHNKTPLGKPVKEIYIFAILVAVMLSALVGEVIGLGYSLGAFFLALGIPDGPPLGATIENRIDILSAVIFMPIFFTKCGLETDVFSIENYKHMWIAETIIVTCFFAKAITVMLVLLYYKMPFRDAFVLALVMNSKGLIELVMYDTFLGYKALTPEIYSLLMLNSVILTMFVSHLVRNLYDPSRQYLTYKRRTIQHIGQDSELGILACVHNQENVPTIFKILEASNPTKESPIHICVLHLVKLVGRDASVLIVHRPDGMTTSKSKPSQSKPILNAFRHYAEKRQFVTTDCFTCISPSDTMHDDVCSLARKNKSLFIIIPFHNQWLAGGDIHSSTQVRTLNYNVLAKAPCSVGILVDRRYTCPPEGNRMYEIAILFIGGADDREALSYGSRMVKQPNVRLMVIRFTSPDAAGNYDKTRITDSEFLSSFRSDNVHNERVMYKEEVVHDAPGLVKAIRSIENAYDLVMVGRRHLESPLMEGLTQWTENPELGIVGDILAAPNFHGVSTIMVVQQQTRVWATPLYMKGVISKAC